MSTRHEIAAICRGALETTSFLGDILASMRRVVPVDGVFIGATDPATTVFSTAGVIENMPQSMCAPWMENEFLVDDVNKFVELHRIGSGATTLHRATNGRPRRSPRHVDVNTPMGFGPELRTTFSTTHACWGVAHLVRESGAPDFSDEELEFVDTVSSDIAAGLRRSVLGTAPRLPIDGVLPGVITLSADGRVISVTDQAIALLQELSHSVISTGSSIDLPGEAYMVATSARARALGRPGPAPVTRVQGRSSGVWLTLRGDCTRNEKGEVDGMVVVVEQSRPSEILPLAVAAYDLTAREEEVLGGVASGLSTSEIAGQLYISAHTVRDHIKSIFEKTGTKSRGELVSTMFFRHAYNSIEFTHV